jgi:hypothetical protein
MTGLAFRFPRLTLAALLAAGGCASLPAPESSRSVPMATRFQQVLDSVKSVSALEADEVAAAPRIRLVVPPTSLAMDRYVESSFRVSSNAYVLVVAVDLDRRVRVLHPQSPDESGFVASSDSKRLSRFFAGFGTAAGYSDGSYLTRYDVSQRISPLGGSGVLLAIASDRPLQLDRLVGPNGDWDEQELARLVFDLSLPGAAHALGRATVLTGQDYNVDYSTFTGDRSFGSYAFAANRLDACDMAFAFGSSRSAYGYGINEGPYRGPMTRFIGLFQRDGQTFARYAQGSCAGARYIDVPVSGMPRPVPPDSAAAPDTSTKRKPIHPGAPRFPSVTAEDGATAGREVHIRLEPSTADRGRERPVTVSGLRFRTPDELAPAGERPADIRMAPRHPRVGRDPQREAAALPMPVREPHARAEPVRAEPVRAEPVRAEPVRAEPARAEPVRAEPVRAEPVRERPSRREPVERVPAPVAPTPTP